MDIGFDWQEILTLVLSALVPFVLAWVNRRVMTKLKGWVSSIDRLHPDLQRTIVLLIGGIWVSLGAALGLDASAETLAALGIAGGFGAMVAHDRAAKEGEH